MTSQQSRVKSAGQSRAEQCRGRYKETRDRDTHLFDDVVCKKDEWVSETLKGRDSNRAEYRTSHFRHRRSLSSAAFSGRRKLRCTASVSFASPCLAASSSTLPMRMPCHEPRFCWAKACISSRLNQLASSPVRAITAAPSPPVTSRVKAGVRSASICCELRLLRCGYRRLMGGSANWPSCALHTQNGKASVTTVRKRDRRNHTTIHTAQEQHAAVINSTNRIAKQ